MRRLDPEDLFAAFITANALKRPAAEERPSVSSGLIMEKHLNHRRSVLNSVQLVMMMV